MSLLKIPFTKPSKWLNLRLIQVSLSNTFASPFGYHALAHINYPTFVLAKSCKLIPVILTGTLIYRKSFRWYKYVSVGLITLGVACFTVASTTDKKSASSSSLYGIMLVLVNLFLDGLTNSTQDHIFKQYKLSSWAMMLYMNFFSTLLMLLYLLVPVFHQTELSAGLFFMRRHPSAIIDIFLFCLCGSLGQIFIFGMMQHFGSLALVSVTVTRKLFTIVVSCICFSHPINYAQIVSVLIAFAGISLESFVKDKEKWIDRKEI
ncbi:uncharacterized protein LOC135122398 [Zophobas morio]|uniref:uncharacterized protein LOC135122398 n=1 Tax=Zophobas morio TaxID=2755281 RepID=UPI0030838C40